MDSDQRHQQRVFAELMFGRALWLKDNLPITADEWGLLCLLIFGGVPEKRPTPEEFARAQAHHMSLGEVTALPVGERAGVVRTVEAHRGALHQAERRGLAR